MLSAILGAVHIAHLLSFAQTEIPYITGGTAIAGVVAIATLFWKIQRSVINPLSDRVEKAEIRLDQEVKARERCEWRNAQVISYLKEHHDIDIPPEVALSTPPWQRNDRLNG